MGNTNSEVEFPDLRNETREIWEQNARSWDAHRAEGDRWHLLLIGSAVEYMLAVQSGELWAAAPSSGSRAAPKIATWVSTSTSAATDIKIGIRALGCLRRLSIGASVAGLKYSPYGPRKRPVCQDSSIPQGKFRTGPESGDKLPLESSDFRVTPVAIF